MIHGAARVCAVMFVTLVAANGQRAKYTSQIANASTTIQGKKISVEYYAPEMHGRKIMGLLVPYGQVWCTGANWATKLTTEADLVMGGLKLAKGSYSIWTIPNEKEWTLIINRETGQFHLNYDASKDLGRTKMTVSNVSAPVEAFKVELQSTGGHGGKLALLWENTAASVDFAIQ